MRRIQNWLTGTVDPMRVYIAASSREIDRAKLCRSQLNKGSPSADRAIIVVSTWMDVIEQVGQANPIDATIDQYRQWAFKDLAEVLRAHVLWLLLPKHPTIGAWIELGFACGVGKTIATSGDHKPIFTPALTHVHAQTDDEIAIMLINHRDLFVK